MKRISQIPQTSLLMLGILALFLSFGCKKSSDDKPTQIPTVLITEVKQMNVPVIKEWIGSTDGYQNAQISARVTGYLLSQNYQEGGFVKANTVLFKIDPRPFEATLAQTKATLAEMQAKALLAQTTLARQTQLYKGKVISQQEFDTSTQSAQADIAAAAAAQANVDAAQLNVYYCTITAPFDGVVGKAQAQIGDLVGSTGSSPLTTMSQLDPIRVYFPISEQEYMGAVVKLERISNVAMDKRPERLQIKLANGEMYDKKGVFDFVNRQVDPTTGTIIIAGLFPNSDNLLRPGQYAKVIAQVDNLENALVIPQQAVNEIQGSSYQVVVVGPDNKTQVKVVKLGMVYGALWVVDSGLKAGEKVVVEGIQKTLVNGTTVIPKPYTPGEVVPSAATAAAQTPSASASQSASPTAASATPAASPAN